MSACTADGRENTIVKTTPNLPNTVSRVNTASHPVTKNGHQIIDGSLLLAAESFHGQKEE